MTAAGSYFVVEYDPKAVKELTKLDKPVARRVVKAVGALSADPRPSGVRALVGYPNLWRIRVGDYRVIYEIHDRILRVIVINVGHRREIYR